MAVVGAETVLVSAVDLFPEICFSLHAVVAGLPFVEEGFAFVANEETAPVSSGAIFEGNGAAFDPALPFSVFWLTRNIFGAKDEAADTVFPAASANTETVLSDAAFAPAASTLEFIAANNDCHPARKLAAGVVADASVGIAAPVLPRQSAAPGILPMLGGWPADVLPPVPISMAAARVMRRDKADGVPKGG